MEARNDTTESGKAERRAHASGRRKAEAESEGCASLAGWSGGAEKMIEFVLEPEKGQERVRYLSTTSLT